MEHGTYETIDSGTFDTIDPGPYATKDLGTYELFVINERCRQTGRDYANFWELYEAGKNGDQSVLDSYTPEEKEEMNLDGRLLDLAIKEPKPAPEMDDIDPLNLGKQGYYPSKALAPAEQTPYQSSSDGGDAAATIRSAAHRQEVSAEITHSESLEYFMYETDGSCALVELEHMTEIPICGNCLRRGHNLDSCTKKLDEYGFLNGCPLCNVVAHNFDDCARRRALSLHQIYEYLVTRRRGLAPIRTALDFRMVNPELWKHSDHTSRPQTCQFAAERHRRYTVQDPGEFVFDGLWKEDPRFISSQRHPLDHPVVPKAEAYITFCNGLDPLLQGNGEAGSGSEHANRSRTLAQPQEQRETHTGPAPFFSTAKTEAQQAMQRVLNDQALIEAMAFDWEDMIDFDPAKSPSRAGSSPLQRDFVNSIMPPERLQKLTPTRYYSPDEADSKFFTQRSPTPSRPEASPTQARLSVPNTQAPEHEAPAAVAPRAGLQLQTQTTVRQLTPRSEYETPAEVAPQVELSQPQTQTPVPPRTLRSARVRKRYQIQSSSAASN